MLFNSLNYFIFFSIILILYWVFPKKWRWILLLIASYFFYSFWNPLYLLLLLFSTSTDYFFSKYLTSSKNLKTSKLGLISTILINLGLLITFKYYTFFSSLLSDLIHQVNPTSEYELPTLSLLLPIGISFYTFQSISYAVDVYRKTIKPEKHFGLFALYIAFFPQLVAGPIERAGNLLPQLNRFVDKIRIEDVKKGIQLILWGLFMKVVIADNLSYFVSLKYQSVANQSGGEMLFATILFSFQVYTDFNGYSTIARGSAKLLGFDLMKNFNYPFFSKSWKELWNRWHISLSHWMRDYIFIPLGGSKLNRLRTYLNIMIVFALSGLWHGSSLTFVFWGLLCGLIWVIEDLIYLLVPLSKSISNNKLIGVFIQLIIFSLFVLSWIPFRSNSIAETILIYDKIYNFKINDLYFWFADNRFSPGMIGLYVLIGVEIITVYFRRLTHFLSHPVVMFSTNCILFFMILLLGHDSGAQFIYFQF